MKTFIHALLACVTLLSFVPTEVKASHCAGAEIEYQWISDSTYRIYLKFYRDCAGADAPTSTDVCYHNNCGTFQGSIPMTPVVGLLPPPDSGIVNGSDIASLCGVQSNCNGGTIPSYRVWWYTGVVTLPYKCDHWIFDWNLNARNAAISNLNQANPAGFSIYVSTTFDNLDAQGDSSPDFSNLPVPFTCINQPFTYSNGAYDINNDSLGYTLIIPLTAPGTNGQTCPSGTPTQIEYASPANTPGDTDNFNILNNPLICSYTFQFSHVTGAMSFIPTALQASVLAVVVSEWRMVNGRMKQIGSVERDIQMVVVPCSNIQPAFKYPLLNSLIGGVYDSSLQAIVACTLNPLSFHYSAVSPNPASYIVVKDDHGTNIPGAVITPSPGNNAASQSFAFSWTPGPTDYGEKTLDVTVKDSSCNSLSGGYALTQIYTIPFYIFQQTAILDDTIICPGGAAHLHAVGGSNFVWNVLPGGSPLSSLNCTTCDSVIATPTVTTQYTVTAQSDTYCKNKDTVTVTVTPPIIVTSTDTTTCLNNSLPLTLNIVAPPPGNLYTVLWSPTSFLSNPNIANPILINDTANTRFIITVTSTTFGHCAVNDTLNVRVLKGFKLYTGDTAICKGNFVQVNATGDAYNYSWVPTQGVSNPTFIAPNITPDTSKRYVITGSFPGCKDTVQTFYIEVQPIPVVIAGADKLICSGDTAHLDGIVTPPYAYSYLWTPDSSLNVDSSEHVVFSGLYTIMLHFKATTTAGCTSSDSLTVKVVTHRFLVVSNDTAVCPHDSLQLHVGGDSLKSFYWHPDYAISDTLSASPTIYPVGNVHYLVYGIDSTNCRDTAAVYVTLRPAAVISLPDTATLYPGDSIQFSPLTNCYTFSWFPVDGLNNPNISDPVAQPGSNTRYVVTGTTEFGCVAKDSIDVFVSPDSYIAIPNAFSPGTGDNAVLKVLHLGEATLNSFRIYNRWGTEVFHTSDINKGWDGEYGGQPQPMGVYVYTVEATTYKGKKFSKQGNVTMLR